MNFIELLQQIRDVIFPDVTTKHSEVTTLEASVQTLKAEVDIKASEVSTNATTAVNSATSASTSATSASDNKIASDGVLANVTTLETSVSQKHAQIIGLTTVANTLSAGSNASTSYNPTTGVMTLGIPQGNKGDKGDAFAIDATGLIADRTTFDTQPKDFSFLATDESLIYFKNSSTSGDWSTGAPFGKGDTGDAGEPIQLNVSAGNIIQWKYLSDVSWTDLIDLDAVYDGTYLSVDGVAVDSAKLGGVVASNFYHTGNKPTASDVGALPNTTTATDIGALPSGSNAVSATKLQTARTINGVAFDGTTNINIPSNETYGWVLKWSGSSTSVDLTTYGEGKYYIHTVSPTLQGTIEYVLGKSISVVTGAISDDTDFSGIYDLAISASGSLYAHSLTKTNSDYYSDILSVYKWEKL